MQRRDPTSRALTPTQWNALRSEFDALPPDLAGLRLLTAIAPMAGRGLRISEAAALLCRSRSLRRYSGTRR